jgi:hypothetical protein
MIRVGWRRHVERRRRHLGVGRTSTPDTSMPPLCKCRRTPDTDTADHQTEPTTKQKLIHARRQRSSRKKKQLQNCFVHFSRLLQSSHPVFSCSKDLFVIFYPFVFVHCKTYENQSTGTDENLFCKIEVFHSVQVTDSTRYSRYERYKFFIRSASRT